jgi:outer membrane protein
MLLVATIGVSPAFAQQKMGYVDSEMILGRMPEYQTVQQQIDRMAKEWETELQEKRTEVDELFRAYQARELLYTEEERRRKREEIVREEEDIERARITYFGPEGELFKQQDQLMRPLQEKVLEAVEEVATRDGYDFVFDRSGEFLFLFARSQHDLSEKVLEELGLDIQGSQASQNRGG